MLPGLNIPLNSHEDNAPNQSSHHYRLDPYPTEFTCNNPSQAPLIQYLVDSQPFVPYEFHEHNNVFTSRLPSPFSRASSLSCHSSSSSNPSHLNPHHQISVAEHDCHSPNLLHPSYLTNSIDFLQPFTSPKNPLIDFPSREVRSESISSDKTSSWKMTPTVNNPEGYLESFQWVEPTSNWQIEKFGLEREHGRSRSEERNVQGPQFHAGKCQSYLDVSGSGDYLHHNHADFQSTLQRRTPPTKWVTDRSSPDAGSPVDHTDPVFTMGTFNAESSLADQFLPTTAIEGPVMAEFPLPRKLGDRNTNLITSKRPKTLRSDAQTSPETGSTPGTAPISKKTKKSAPRSTRTGNNGGRCRRLAPANRECPHCGDKFTRNDRLNYHIDSIHEHKERKYKCNECSKAFRQRCDLQRHMRHVHKFIIRQN